MHPREKVYSVDTVIAHTGLALMGFSQSCPSSLDLTKFVVRSRRGAMRQLSVADSLESRILGIWKSRNLEIWDPKKKKNSKIQIRFAQNVGKVWISRNKILLAPFGIISNIFCVGRKL